MTAHSIETRSQRASLPQAPLLALAALVAVAAAFAVAFLLSHHGAPKPAAPKIVDATIKPGPSTATLKKAFATSNIHPLIKPVVHKKKPTPAPAVSSASDAGSTSDGSSSSDTYTPPATTYTPPATSSSGSSGTSSAPKKKSPPSGDGIITIG